MNNHNKENYNTLEYYNKNAKQYFEQTKVADFQIIYDKFLKQLPKNAYILDLGCGSGRDSKYFIDNGYKVKAVDGSIEMCKLASEYINQQVECMKFEDLKDIKVYDGIWMCTSIVHVEKEKLPNILTKIVNALKDDGTLYISFKVGSKYEIKEGKYYTFLTENEMKEMLNKIDKRLKFVEYFETDPCTKRIEKNLIWGNLIMKKSF